MPTSLFQYEMLPTTWFYMSSLLILAVFFRFNRLFSVRNADVLALMLMTPGLVYIAMGSALQGYLWLYLIGALIFVRLASDVFLRRRPIIAPNLNFSGLAFSCVAASAFMIPNLFLNRGDACESPRAWRLEQILSAAEDWDDEVGAPEKLPGYRPFLRAAQKAARYFAPSQESWRRAADARERMRDPENVEFFGISIRVYHTSRESKRPAANAMRWASGASEEYAYSLEGDHFRDWQRDPRSPGYFPESLNGVSAAQTIPRAPVAPRADEAPRSAESATNSSPALPSPDRSISPAASEQPEDDHVADLAQESTGFHWQPLTAGGLALVLCVVCVQIGIVTSIVSIGRFHFGSAETGCATALLYLLLPYINQFSARLDHIVPALAILTAVALYRRPFLSGASLGIAGSLVFYPFFLLPLWLGYYWKKGAGRFAVGASASILTMALVLLLLVEPGESYGNALTSMFGGGAFVLSETQGLWEYLPRFYRIPIIALFGVFCCGSSLWLPRRNLGVLIACSAALMLGAQFWMGRQGGLYMAWYLPLVLLTVFRPNLADRTAATTVADLYPKQPSPESEN